MYKVLICFLALVMWVACGGGDKTAATASGSGEAICKKYCVTCHGIDGKLGLNGYKDLSISKLTEAERIVQVTKGKNTMTPFEGILSPEEIKAVVAYTMTLSGQ